MAEKKTELEILQEIADKQELSLKEVKEMKAEAVEAKVKAEEFKLLVADMNTKAQESGKTIGELQTEVKELKSKQGHNVFSIPGMTERKSVIMQIAEKIEENKAQIIASANGRLMEPIELKTVGVLTDANFTGTNAPYRSYLDWKPGMEPIGQFRFRSLVRTIMSALDNVSFPRANIPVGEGSFARQASQTTAKEQIDRDYTMIDLLLKPMSGFAIVARRALVNTVFLQSWLPTSMLDQLEGREDTDFADTLSNAATGSTSTTGLSSSGAALILRFVAIIKNMIQAKHNPGTMCVDPNVWANAMLNVESNAGFSLPNVLTVDPAGNVRILGRIIQPVNWLSSGRSLTADWSTVAIIQSEGLTLRQSDSHASIFSSNQVAFLLERTEAVAMFRPEAITTFVH